MFKEWCKGPLFAVCRLFLFPLVTADPAPVEALVSGVALWWGIILLTAAPFQEGATGFHDLLFIHAPRGLWTTSFLLLGGGIIIARFLNKQRVERVLMFVSTGIWAFVTALLCTVSPLSFATGTYALLALVSGWAYWRLRYE